MDEIKRAVEKPETVAGRCAFAYIESFNSGDEDRISAFWRNYGGAVGDTLKQRVEEDQAFRKRTGKLIPFRILYSSEHVLSIQTRSEKGGAYWFLDFHLLDRPPHGLVSNSLTGPVTREVSESEGLFFVTADDQLRRRIIDKIVQLLRAEYVFPDQAEAMADLIQKKRDSGEYDELTSLARFTAQLTEDLRSLYDDHHLIVEAGVNKEWERGEDLSEEEREVQLAERRFENFGFHRAERLPGNVGYLDLRKFADPRDGGDTAVSAMNFLAFCDALIIDLRKNNGGMSSMEQLIASYFFERPTHMISFYRRGEDTTKQFWTHAHVQGPRMAKTPLYLVLGPDTASSAEAFAYTLKHLDRATLVGETTSGSAHGSQTRVFPDLIFTLHLPLAQPLSPITGTNWEGNGVAPHVKAPAEEAMQVAYLKALEALLAKETEIGKKKRIEWVLEGVEGEMRAKTIDRSDFAAYTGTYLGSVKVWIDGEFLIIKRPDHAPYPTIPMGEDRFMTNDHEQRVQFIRDETGEVQELCVLFQDGRRMPLPRIKE